MSLKTFKYIIHWIPRSFDVYFSGFCEPFINPSCTEMILHAYQKGHHVMVFTTMVGLTKNNFQRLIKTIPFTGKNYWIIHLPSTNKLESIVVDNSYLELLEFVLQSDMNIKIHYHGNNINDRIKQIICRSRYALDYWQLISRAGNVSFKDIDQSRRLSGPIRCMRADLHAHIILPDGTVVLCCNDFGMKHILGNVFNQSYHQIHNSGEMKKVKMGLYDDSISLLCRNCNYAENINVVNHSHDTPFGIRRVYSYFKTQITSRNPNIYKKMKTIKHKFT